MTTQQDRVQGLIGSLGAKAPCRVSTSADVTLSGYQTIDDVLLVDNDRVLVKNQTDATENGIYYVTSGAWERAPDFDGTRDVVQGTLVAVAEGTDRTNTLWQLSSSGTTIGTSSLAFTQIMGSEIDSRGIKPPCRVATSANITLSGLQTIDSVALAEDDRVLVRSQTTASENGIYYATSGAWVRVSDFDSARDIIQGTLVPVAAGTVYANTVWQLSSTGTTIGTSSLTFTQFIPGADAGANTDITSLDGLVSVNGGALAGVRNLVPGGDLLMNRWTNGTSFTAPADAAYTADGFRVKYVTAGAVDVLKSADAPTVAEAGVYTSSCITLDVTTADSSIAAGDLYALQCVLNGERTSFLGFGQAGTRNITLSFWHKHTKTGTHCVSFTNSAGNRSYVATYTQGVTNTWEKATVTLAVDASGTWLYDIGSTGLIISFTAMAGTTFQTIAGAWAAGNYFATSAQVNNLDSTANFFKIALVQLERGSTATVFEPNAPVDVPTTYASSAENAAGTIENKAVDPLGIREAFNATGSAPVYACRAWVNWNGTGTVAIRAAGNVGSMTDNGVGDYTANITTAMPDVDYITLPSLDYGSYAPVMMVRTQLTTSVRVFNYADTAGSTDRALLALAIIR